MAIESKNEHPLIVDLTSRTITVPEELKYIGVETDNNSEKVWFKVPRYFDEPDVQGQGDLFSKVAQVHFLNAGGSYGVYTITETKDNEDGTISLAWLIGKDVTEFSGDVKFQLVFTLFDNGNNVYKLSTTPATLVVRAGINTKNFSVSKESATYDQLIELIYDGYETLKAVDTETLKNLSASPKKTVSSLEKSTFTNLDAGLYLYTPEDTTDEYYGYVVYWNGSTVSDPIVKYLTTTFSNSCIETKHIADGAVTNEKLADNSVDTTNIVDGSVTGNKLADNSVSNAKLSDSAITMDKLAHALYKHNDGYEYGVIDAVNALVYNINGIDKIGVLSDGTPVYRKTISRSITDNEKTLGYISDLLSDYHTYMVTILGVNLYMVSPMTSEDAGVIVPLNYKYSYGTYWDGVAGENVSKNTDIVYLNGIVSEQDGIYKVKAANGESWLLAGTIVFAATDEFVSLM